MTAHQFALAVGADEKWVQNAFRILDRPTDRAPVTARWLGLVRLLHQTLGLPLTTAATVATEALTFPPDTRQVRLTPTADGSATLEIDLARYHSAFLARLSSALILSGPRQRGRRQRTVRRGSRRRRDALAAARAHGVDLTLLSSALARTPAERLALLDENAAFLTAARGSANVPTLSVSLG